MLYDFGKSTYSDLQYEIDGKDLEEMLRDRLTHKCGTEDKYLKRVRKMVKTPDEFNYFKELHQISALEFIKLLHHLYPKMFEYHLLKFIKENYLTELKGDL